MAATRSGVSAEAFSHEALIYAGEQEFLAATVPFVTGGLDRDEPVLVALPLVRLDLLRSALDDRKSRIGFLAMEDIGRNPACIIPAWQEFVDARPSDGRAIRGIGEPVWSERDPDEYDECHLHESLLNEAFENTSGFTLVCPYDTDSLDPNTVAEAQRTHPVLLGRTGRSDSDRYSASEVREERFRAPLAAPTGPVIEHVITGTPLPLELRDLRHAVADHGYACQLTPERVHDLVLAVDELVVNSLRHGGGTGVLRMWRDGRRAICEVRDGGLLDDAMVGRVKPPRTFTGGRGIWMVNQLCDFVQVRSGSAGTVVRVAVGPEAAAV